MMNQLLLHLLIAYKVSIALQITSQVITVTLFLLETPLEYQVSHTVPRALSLQLISK